MASSASASYPVRLTGAPPAPSSTSTSSSRKKKSPPPPPPLQRHTLTITPTLTLPQLRLDATRLFGVELADYDVELLTGFPPKKLEVPEEKNGFGEEVLVKDWVGRNEVVTVRFVPCAGNGGAAVGNGNGGSRSGNKKSKAAPKAKRGTAGGKGKKRSRPAVAAAAAAADGNSSDEYEYNDSIGATAGASPSRRSKRAASAAAAAAMPDVIAAQDKLMREQGLTSNRSTKRRKSSGGKKSSGTGIGGSSAAASSPAARAAAAEKRAAAAASRKMAAMPGRRLGDGAGVAPTASAAAAAAAAARKSTAAASAGGGGRKKATNLFGQMSSEEDVSYALMNSLSSGGGGSGGKVGKVLRTAMRGAIGKAYEASRAVVRVDAVRGQNFALVPKGTEGGGRLGGAEDGGSTASHVGRYVVTYSKGVEGRGQYEEDVEIIALEALRAVVGAVHADNGGGDGQDEDGAGGDTSGGGGGGGGGREMLRPASMAQLSPRVFWSLAHHFPGRSTEEALRALLPDLDWSFLEGRSRMLSEKARENLRQEKVARGEIVDDQEEGNPEAMGEYAKGVEAVEEVERAMGEMAERDRTSARDRAARAALARFGGDTDGEAIPASSQAQQQQKEEEEAWTLITPTDEDEDELAECIREGFASAEPTLEPSKSDVKTWTSSLMQKYSVHNWRQLANVSEGAEMVSSLEVLGARPTEDDVERWIESARARTIEEIMLEIVGGNEEAFVALRDGARAGTPKDLYAWRAVSDMLLEEILGYAGADAKGTTAQDVQRWCARAGVALKEAPWLEWYATPVI